MDLTIPETILLLGTDDETGKPVVDDTVLGMAFAVGALAQLAMDGRVRIAGEGEAGRKPGTFVALDGTTDARLEPLVALIEGKEPAGALGRIVGLGGARTPAGRLRADVLEEFAALGVLVRQEERFLGMTWSERWERGERRDVEDALQARARALLLGEGDGPAGAEAPDAGGRALGASEFELAAALAILHIAGSLPKAFPDIPEEELVAAGDALAADDWASGALRDAIAQLQGAMVAMMVPTMIVPIITS